MTGYKVLFLIILPTKHDSKSVFFPSSSAFYVPATPRVGRPHLWLENKTSNLTEFDLQAAFFIVAFSIIK